MNASSQCSDYSEAAVIRREAVKRYRMVISRVYKRSIPHYCSGPQQNCSRRNLNQVVHKPAHFTPQPSSKLVIMLRQGLKALGAVGANSTHSRCVQFVFLNLFSSQTDFSFGSSK